MVALYAGLTLLYVWPLLAAFGSRLPADTGDPGLNTWILWWNAHAFPFTDRWWNAPIFAPVRGAFAFSETLLSLSIISTPVQWLGGSAVEAYNTLFVVSFFSAAIGAHALAHRLTGRHGAALVAGIAFGFNPYRAAQLPHLQTLMSCWMPLGLLALHRYRQTHRRRDLAWLAACWLLNGLTTGYFLVFFAVLVACWVAWFVRSRRELIALGTAIAAGSLPLVPLLIGYQRHQAALGFTRSMGEIVFFSADVSALWAASAYAWFAQHWTLAPRPEGELYPGGILLALVLTGVVAGAWQHRGRVRATITRRRVQRSLVVAGALVLGVALLSALRGGWQGSLFGLSLSTTHPFKTVTTALWLFIGAGIADARLADAWHRRSLFAFYVLAAAVMFVFALGPLGHAFGREFFYMGPYAWLMHLPGGGALRVPARFATPMILCLAQAGALACARFWRGRASAPIIALIAAAIAIDGWVPKLKTDPVPAPVDLSQAVRQLNAVAPGDGIHVLELPIVDSYADTAAMLRATRHGLPLINGYSGYAPPHYPVLQRALNDRDPGVFRFLRDSVGDVIVFVDRTHDPGGQMVAYVSKVPSTIRVADTPQGTLFAVPWVTSGTFRDELPTPLRYRSVVVEGGAGTADLLLDDDQKTAWRSAPTGGVPPVIRITFPRPVVIGVVQLTVRDVLDYPQRIRVSAASSSDASPRNDVVWEGGLAHAALISAFDSPHRLQIDTSGRQPADVWTLTLLSDDPSRSWAIAELRLFGSER